MKAGVRKWAVVVLLSVFASGCSALRARTGTPDKDWTVYPGVRLDANEMGDVFSGERREQGWVNGLVVSILVLDLPFSAVFDTVVLPYDLYRIYVPAAPGAAHESSSKPANREAIGAGEER